MQIADVQDIIDHEMLSHEEIINRIHEVAKQIDKDYEGKTPIVVCILKGASATYYELTQAMKTKLKMDFMSLSSYGSGFESTGKITVRQDLSYDVAGEDVLIVEDIVDSGNTLHWLVGELKRRGAKSVEIFSLLEKPARHTAKVDLKYKGFVIPDEFVFGFGLDYDEMYRNLDSIAVMKPEMYEGENS